MTPKKFLKTYINNITEQEFKIITIRLIAGLEKKAKKTAENLLLQRSRN